MDTTQAQQYLVETCKTVIDTFATQYEVEKSSLNIRIDLENITAKPVFALFEKSNFLAPCSLKEIIHAGGGQGFTMLLGMHIKSVIKDLFKASLERLELSNTKELFLLLFLSDDQPYLAIFAHGKFQERILIAEIIAS